MLRRLPPQPARLAAGRVARAIVAAILVSVSFACDQRLSITPVNEGFNNAKADDALQRATAALLAQDGPDDVACGVVLNRSGNVPTPISGRNTLDTDQHVADTFAKPGYVKVVHKINRCRRTTAATIIGCAITGNMIVEDLTDNGDSGIGGDLAGILWAHEFGHTQGLPHRDPPTSCIECIQPGICFDPCAVAPRPPPNRVMASFITPNNLRVNQTECNAFRKPRSSVACNICEGGICFDQCRIGTSAEIPGAEVPGDKVDIREFVRRIYPDSMPIEAAMQYGPEDIPVLLEMLVDEEERASWPMVASVLGIVGDDRAAEALIDFITKERRGWLRSDMNRAIGSALVALGYLVNQSGDPAALRFLSRASAPGFWEHQQGLRWQSAIARTRGERSRRMAGFAVMGLGLSGDPAAWTALEQRWQVLDRRDEDAPTGEIDEMKALVEQSMEDHARVSRAGLRGYYGR